MIKQPVCWLGHLIKTTEYCSLEIVPRLPLITLLLWMFKIICRLQKLFSNVYRNNVYWFISCIYFTDLHYIYIYIIYYVYIYIYIYIIIYQTYCFMCKIHAHLLPSNFVQFVNKNYCIHTHYTRQNDVHVISHWINVREFIIKIHGVSLWNNLPSILKEFFSFNRSKGISNNISLYSDL